jgi:hypothetical protein
MNRVRLSALLIALECAAFLAARAGVEYGPTIFKGNVSVGSWAACSNLSVWSVSGGTYTNVLGTNGVSVWTNYYRLTGTNSLGRLPYSTNAVYAHASTTNGTNAVLLSWTRYDGVLAYILERSADAAAWTNWVRLSNSATNYTDYGTNTWSTNMWTNGIMEMPVPTVPWGAPGSASNEPLFAAWSNTPAFEQDVLVQHDGVPSRSLRFASGAGANTNSLRAIGGVLQLDGEALSTNRDAVNALAVSVLPSPGVVAFDNRQLTNITHVWLGSSNQVGQLHLWDQFSRTNYLALYVHNNYVRAVYPGSGICVLWSSENDGGGSTLDADMINSHHWTDVEDIQTQLDRNSANDAWLAFSVYTDRALSVTPMADGFRDGFADTNGIASGGSNYTWSVGGVVWGTGNGPDAHYKLNDNAANATVADASGNGLDGSYTTANTEDRTTSGVVNAAIHFPGNDYVLVGDDPVFEASTAVSLACWAYAEANGNNGIGGKTVLGSDLGDYVLLTAGGGMIYWRLNSSVTEGNGQVTTDAGALPLNTWTHIAAVYDGSTQSIWTNGALCTNAAYSTTLNDNYASFVIGAYHSSQFGFVGAIDDFRYYSRGLTAGEIAFLYNAGSGTEAAVGTPPNMGFRTQPVVLDFVPTEGRLFLAVDAPTCTAGVDVVGWVSRDAGANWTSVPLVDDGALFATGTVRRWATSISNFVGGASQSNLVAWVESRNNKSGTLRGLAVQCR